MKKTQSGETRWEKIKIIVSEIVVAFLLFYIVVELSNRFAEQQQSMVPASAWFKVNEVFVPDHKQGSNPLLIYDRTILVDFRGFFVIEVQQQLENGLWFSACSGSGMSDYEIGDTIPDKNVSWEWFILRACPVPPGTYRLRVSWELKKLGWPSKETVALSNIFKVY